MTSILTEQLQAHCKWLADCPDGKQLILRDADLRDADLTNAVLRDADLRYADLTNAVLRYADLTNAVLRYADLTNAVLTNAVLRDADLRYADLRGAALRGAALSGADLRDADLRDADLRGAIGLPVAADAAGRLQAVARAALEPNALEMSTWHTCETTHCMAGWAVHLAGELGRLLEASVGTEIAGLYLLGVEAYCYFFKDNEEARKYLQGVIEND